MDIDDLRKKLNEENTIFLMGSCIASARRITELKRELKEYKRLNNG